MATLVSTGQITITDSNDYISTGATAPANPVAGVTLWVDTTVSPNQLKKWNGTSWEVVNEVQVGGRNFLLNSNFNKYAIGTTPAWDTSLNGTYGSIDNWSSGYNAGFAAPAVGYHAHLDTATFGYPVLAYIDRNTAYGYPHRWMGINQAFTDANSYVRKAIAIGVKITMSAEVYADTVGAKVQFGLYHYMLSTGTMNFEGLLVNTNAATSDDINKWVKRSITFTVNANWDTSKQFQVYVYGYTSSVECTNYVRNVKLELGNQATDWTVAQEDTDATIATAQATADDKAKHFTGTAYPTPPYVAGRDTWTNGTDLFECAVTRATGSYVANDFVKATGYDNTQTVIDGGLVTAGTIQLAGDSSNILAGITGQGTAGTSVRIWAGGSYANRATANFRVTQAGDVYSKSSYQVQNANNETNGGLSGEGTDAASIRAWFGATYANRASAPTRILQSGKLVATDIQLGNSSTGWNIGSYGNMTCFVGNSTIDNAYIVLDDRLRSGGFKNSAKIGTQVWSSASTIRGTAAFECNEANSVGPNIALYAKATNGNYNFSFRGEGKAVADSFIGCIQNTLDPSIDGSDIVFEKGNIVQIYNSSTSNYYVYLPSMSSIRSSLNIGSSIAFTIRLLVVVSRGSTAITLTTRSGTGTMYDHNGGTFTNFAMGQGDSIEFLGYSNGSYMEWQLLSIWD